jgi:hypothetical protein
LTVLLEFDIIVCNDIEFNIISYNRRVEIEIQEAPGAFLEEMAGVPIL